MPTPPTTPRRSWHFVLDWLPPSINHTYGYTRTGRRYILPEAEVLRESIRTTAQLAGFRPDLKKKYGVYVVLTMPAWDTSDVDSPIKSLLDSALSSRSDHRIIRLLVDKVVQPGSAPRCDVSIYEMTALPAVVDVAALFGQCTAQPYSETPAAALAAALAEGGRMVRVQRTQKGGRQ